MPENAWYYSDVKNAYETGLINGRSNTTYDPSGNMTYAEAVKLAACMHQLYTTGAVTLGNGLPWYQTYVDYAKTNGIIARDYAWTKNATRAEYMEIFANALPDSALQEINTVPDSAIMDVPMTHAQANAIYKLYRAGVLQGSSGKWNGETVAHLCKPEDNVTRAEVAAILTRMMHENERIAFDM